MDEGLRKGQLKFALHGEKLKGNWALVRMGGHAAQESKPNWLLIKEHDEFERGAEDEPITEEAPDSVVTGRDLGCDCQGRGPRLAIGPRLRSAGPNRSRLTLRRKTADDGKTLSAGKALAPPDRSSILKDAPREAMPKFISPELALSVDTPPAGDGWLHELKLDGYRIQAHVAEQKRGPRKATLYSRKGLDWTHRMPEIAREMASLR